MNRHEFTTEQLRRVIFGDDVFRKCPACDNLGLEYWDVNGRGTRPAPLPEWGDEYDSGACEKCDGLGYNLFPANTGL